MTISVVSRSFSLKPGVTMKDTIVVFTRKSVEEIMQSGGSDDWVLDPEHARSTSYLVCTRNTKGSKGKEPHGSGFLIGRISDIVESPVAEGASRRYLIQISEWARIDRPGLWTFGRNPVRYLDIAELGIDVEAVEFEPMPSPGDKPLPMPLPAPLPAAHAGSNGRQPIKLTIAQAKAGLALGLGVSLDSIEITVRG
jgi:hypothetical protein